MAITEHIYNFGSSKARYSNLGGSLFCLKWTEIDISDKPDLSILGFDVILDK